MTGPAAAEAERQAWREAALARLDIRLAGLTDPAQVTGRELAVLAVLALLALQTVQGAGSTEVLRAAATGDRAGGPARAGATGEAVEVGEAAPG